MAQNPLQKFFRQPKIYISLPSHGIFNQEGSIQGDVENMPVFGMTGMDEIIIKTPDALLTGESTVSVIESCCPFIKNAWDLSALDTDVVLTAIRIATYGNKLSVSKKCNECGSENEYELDLNAIIEHYNTCVFDNTLVLKEMTVKIRPLSYKQSTEFSLRNFKIQQQLKQVSMMENETEKSDTVSDLFKQLGVLQNEIYTEAVESVQTNDFTVDEKMFIREWLENTDKSVIESIKSHIQKNQEVWSSPKYNVKCDSCDAESNIIVDLDLSTFFVKA